MESSHTYATNSHDWNQIFPLFDNFRFRSIEGKLTFGFHQYYHYSNPFSTEEENSKKSSHSKYQNRNFKQSQQQFHKKNRFLVPKQYDSIKYVDYLIGWDRFSLDLFKPQYHHLYDLASRQSSRITHQKKDQSFCTLGKCYSKKLDCQKKTKRDQIHFLSMKIN